MDARNRQASFYSSYLIRTTLWAGHVECMPMNRAPRQLLTGWVAHPRPIGCPEMNFDRTLKKSAETQRPPHRLRNVERHRPRQATVAAAGPLYAQPSDAKPSDAQHSDAQPASCQPQRPSPRLLEPCPCLRSPDLVRAPRPSAIRRNARRRPRRRYAARANRANAPPQQHHLAQGIALDN
jgi:hypothetical protein